MMRKYLPISSGSRRKWKGRITRLNVRDNQFVKQGELLFEIDDRPYRTRLKGPFPSRLRWKGKSQTSGEELHALVSGVSVSQANIQSSQADVTRWAAAVDQARADVANAEQGVKRAKAEWTYANNNLHRLEPLLDETVCHRRSGGPSQNVGNRPGRGSEAGGVTTQAFAGSIAVRVGAIRTLRSCARTEQGAT